MMPFPQKLGKVAHCSSSRFKKQTSELALEGVHDASSEGVIERMVVLAQDLGQYVG